MKAIYLAGAVTMVVALFSFHRTTNSNVMLSNPNSALVKNFYAALNAGQPERLDTIVAADFQDYNASPDQPKGLDGFRTFLQRIMTAYPDLRIDVKDLIAENNKVVARLVITGTHKGVLMDSIQPTNKKIQWTGIDIFEINNGKITGRWSERNLLSMLIQLGAFPK